MDPGGHRASSPPPPALRHGERLPALAAVRSISTDVSEDTDSTDYHSVLSEPQPPRPPPRRTGSIIRRPGQASSSRAPPPLHDPRPTARIGDAILVHFLNELVAAADAYIESELTSDITLPSSASLVPPSAPSSALSHAETSHREYSSAADSQTDPTNPDSSSFPHTSLPRPPSSTSQPQTFASASASVSASVPPAASSSSIAPSSPPYHPLTQPAPSSAPSSASTTAPATAPTPPVPSGAADAPPASSGTRVTSLSDALAFLERAGTRLEKVLRAARGLVKHPAALVFLLDSMLAWSRGPPVPSQGAQNDALANADTTDEARRLEIDFVLAYSAWKMVSAVVESAWASGPADITTEFERHALARMRAILCEPRASASAIINENRTTVVELFSRSVALLTYPVRVSILAREYDEDLRALIPRRQAPAIVTKAVNAVSKGAVKVGNARRLHVEQTRGRLLTADDVAVGILKCLRFTALHNVDKWPDPAIAFLRYVHGYASLPCSAQVQAAVSEVLAETLGVLDPKRLPETTSWDEVIKPLFDRFSHWASISKRTHLVQPGFAALLSVQRANVYNSEVAPFLRVVYRNYNDPKTRAELRAASLKSLMLFLRADFVRSPRDRVMRQLEDILQEILYNFTQWATADRSLIVDLLGVITRGAEPDIASQVVAAMLHHGDDAALAALNAYQSMVKQLQHEAMPVTTFRGEGVTSTEADEGRPWQRNPSSPVARALYKLSRPLRKVLSDTSNALSEYIVDIETPSDFQSRARILTAALTCWHLSLLHLGSDAIEHLRPGSIDPDSLIRLCSHSKRSIRVEAKKVVERIFLRYEDARAPYLVRIVGLVAGLPSTAAALLEETLIWMTSLVRSWRRFSVDPGSGTKQEVPFQGQHLVEAQSVLQMCNSLGVVRLRAKYLFLEFQGLLSDLDSSFDSELGPLLALAEVDDNVIQSESLKDQKQWRRFLCSRLLDVCTGKSGKYRLPSALRSVWTSILRQLPDIRSKVEATRKGEIVKAKGHRIAAIDRCAQWRFFVAVAAATAVTSRDDQIIASDFLEKNTAFIEPKEAREFYRMMTSFWINTAEVEAVNSSNPVLEENYNSVAEALLFTHPVSAELLLPEMKRTVEDWLNSGEGGPSAARRLRRRKETVRLQIEYVYQSLIPRLASPRPELNLLSPNRSSCYAQIEFHVRETKDFLTRTQDENSPYTSALRRAFCDTVSELNESRYEDARRGDTQLDYNLVVALFLMAASWSRYFQSGNVTQDRDQDRSTPGPDTCTRAAASLIAIAPPETKFFEKCIPWSQCVFNGDDRTDQERVRTGLERLCSLNAGFRNSLIDLSYASLGDKVRRAAANFFLVLCSVVSSSGIMFMGQSPDAKLLTVLLWKLGEVVPEFEDTPDVMQPALDTLRAALPFWMSNDALENETMPLVRTGTLSCSGVEAQNYMGTFFASNFASLAPHICGEILNRTEKNTLSNDERHQAILLLVPWVKVLESSNFADGARPIQRMLQLTDALRSHNHSSLERVWASLARSRTEELLDTLIKEAMRRLDEYEGQVCQLLQTYKFVVLCALQAGRDSVFRCLAQAMKQGHGLDGQDETAMRFVHSYLPQRTSVSLANSADAAVVLVSEIACQWGGEVREVLPVLLHAAVLGLERPYPVVVQSSKTLLKGLLDSSLRRSASSDASSREDVRAGFARLVRTLNTCEHNPADNPEQVERIARITREVASLLSYQETEVSKRWSSHALQIGKSSSNRFVTSRSLLVVRTIGTSLRTDEALDFAEGIRTGLLAEFGSPLPGTPVVVELISTLAAVIDSMTENDLLRHPQLYWTCVVLLGSEFAAVRLWALRIVQVFIGRVFSKLPDGMTLALFSATAPASWVDFEGIQPLVLDSLITNNDVLTEVGYETLSLMTFTIDSNMQVTLLDKSPHCLARNIVGLLPWFCAKLHRPGKPGIVGTGWSRMLRYYDWIRQTEASIDENDEGQLTVKEFLQDTSEPCEAAAQLAALACRQAGALRLAQVFVLYAQRWRTLCLDDFLFALRKPLAEAFFPKHVTAILCTLLSSLGEISNSSYSYVLQILISVLYQIEPGEVGDIDVEQCASLFGPVVQGVCGACSHLAVKALDLAIYKFGAALDPLSSTLRSDLAGRFLKRGTSMNLLLARLDGIEFPGFPADDRTTVRALPVNRYESVREVRLHAEDERAGAKNRLISPKSSPNLNVGELSGSAASPKSFFKLPARNDDHVGFLRRVRRRQMRRAGKAQGFSLDSYESILSESKSEAKESSRSSGTAWDGGDDRGDVSRDVPTMRRTSMT